MVAAILALASFTASGCVLLGQIVELAYGETLRTVPPIIDVCPEVIRCSAPYCKFVQENGSFEIGVNLERPTRWSGDFATTESAQHPSVDIPKCDGQKVLAWGSTVPFPSSGQNSRSSQLFQVIDLATHIPPLGRPVWRNVRAAAAFYEAGTSNNNAFRLRLDAYTGDPLAYPASGDPETFETTTANYSRIMTVDKSDMAPMDAWLFLSLAMVFPENADFLVVFIESVENVTDEIPPFEFGSHYADRVQVVLDQGDNEPFASNDIGSTIERIAVDIPVLDNDNDVDGSLDPSSIRITRSPEMGSASVNPVGTITYTPETELYSQNTTSDEFTYQVADDEGLFSNSATVTVYVSGVYDPPEAVDDIYELNGFDPLDIFTPGILANDIPHDFTQLHAELVSDVSHGILALSDDGSFVYTPDQGFLGDDTFRYKARDSFGKSKEATVTLDRLVGPNQAPMANDDEIETIVNVTVDIDVTGNDTDPDGFIVPATVMITEMPTNGTAQVLPDGKIRYVPNTDYTGMDQLKYTVQDNQGLESNEATVDVTIFA